MQGFGACHRIKTPSPTCSRWINAEVIIFILKLPRPVICALLRNCFPHPDGPGTLSEINRDRPGEYSGLVETLSLLRKHGGGSLHVRFMSLVVHHLLPVLAALVEPCG